MALVRLAGAPVLALRLTLPTEGAWFAAVELDAEEAPRGVVELEDAAITYRGAVLRSGVVSGVCRAELVGGTGGLVRDVPARSFRDVTARVLFEDLLSSVGEALDPSSTRPILASRLPFWSRAAERASRALSTLTGALEGRWRVLPWGTVWIGTESWSEASESLVALELDRDDAASSVLLATETLELRPGVTLDGRRVGRVEHAFGRDEPLRTTFWIEP
jgi:hypothetical protein